MEPTQSLLGTQHGRQPSSSIRKGIDYFSLQGKFATAHKQHHQILEGLMEHGYKGINERAKVRHLMAGIKDPTLTVVKSQILATPEIQNNFDRAVILYKDFITQTETHKNPDVQIAAVTSYAASASNASNVGCTASPCLRGCTDVPAIPVGCDKKRF